MYKKVLRTIEAFSLFSTGDKVIAAVSGGADSVALLDILASLDQRLQLVVAHLNHSLRGADSDGDELFVRELATRYRLPCEVEKFDVKGLSGKRKLSLEEAGRMARYAFLHRVAARHGAAAIALGHHADDQAETLLMRLLRGAGTTGLASIAPKTGDNLVRPLLQVTRGEIEAYLQARGISYRSDASNLDTNFLRNRVRHELLPYLATYNPAVRDRLAATAEALAADEALLEEITDRAFACHGNSCDGISTLCVAGVRAEPSATRLRLYRRALLLAKGDLARIGSRHLRAVDRLIFSEKPNGSLHLPDGVRASRAYESVSFSMPGKGTIPSLLETSVHGPGSYHLHGGGLLLVAYSSFPGGDKPVPPGVAYFDSEVAPFPWLVRGFRAGDRMVPLGMNGSKKVKSIFIEQKIPIEARRRFPLIFSGDRLIWLCGLRVSAQTRVTERTGRVIRAEILDFTR